MDADKVGVFVNEIWRGVSTYIDFIGSSLNSFLEPANLFASVNESLKVFSSAPTRPFSALKSPPISAIERVAVIEQ